MSNSLIDREITQGVIPIGMPKAYKYDAALVEAAKASVQQGMNQLHTDGNSIISQANTILAAIRNQGGYPLKAATASAMTDTTKIYVYTGSETGYTFGDWYYHNGTAWTDGGVYNATAFNTDTTLTVPGAAADAKVVGDKFDDVKYVQHEKTPPLGTTFMDSYALLDFFSSAYDSLFSASSIKTVKRGHYSLFLEAKTNADISLFIPLAFTAGKKYDFSFTFSADSGANIRLFDGSSAVRSFSSGTSYTLNAVEGADYKLRLYVTRGQTLNITFGDIREHGKVDTVKGVNINKDYTEWLCNKTETVTWTEGKINTNGTIDSASTQYHFSNAFPIRKNGTYTLANENFFVELQYYSEEPVLGTTVPTGKVSLNAKTWVADVDGYVSFTAHTDYLSDINCNFNVIEQIDAVQTTNTKELLIVTQNEIVNSVQKQVVETQIETVAGARFASQYGVLPSNSASENTTNMQALLDGGGTIVVDLPGIYEFNQCLFIGSNTALICYAGVYFKQDTYPYGMILNKGALTKEYDSNIVVDGINFICGTNAGSSDYYVKGLRGKIAFYYAKNVTIKNIKCLDLNAYIFFIHIARFENVIIDGCEIIGLKDGIHVSCGDGLLIRDCITGTHDDGIALNAHDYAESCPELGWIKNVTIDRWRNVAAENVTPGSRGILVLGGAWLDWASGNYYMRGDSVVAANGYVYRLIAPVLVDENDDPVTYQSTVQPTHLSGEQTYSDGLTWRCVQHNTVYNCGVENLTIKDAYLDVQHADVVLFNADEGSFSRGVYPGAYAPQHKNITLDGISVNPAVQTAYPVLVNVSYPCDFIRIEDCEYYGYAVIKCRNKSWQTINDNNKVRINIVGCRLIDNMNHGSAMKLAYLQQDYALVCNATMNYVNANMTNRVEAGSVSMINDDLTTGNS